MLSGQWRGHLPSKIRMAVLLDALAYFDTALQSLRPGSMLRLRLPEDSTLLFRDIADIFPREFQNDCTSLVSNLTPAKIELFWRCV